MRPPPSLPAIASGALATSRRSVVPVRRSRIAPAADTRTPLVHVAAQIPAEYPAREPSLRPTKPFRPRAPRKALLLSSLVSVAVFGGAAHFPPNARSLSLPRLNRFATPIVPAQHQRRSRRIQPTRT